MKDNMYDKEGMLKPAYDSAESIEKAKNIKYDTEKIDPRTDFGKGIVFKSVDGGDHASMESVKQTNKAYWDKTMNILHNDYGQQDNNRGPRRK